MRLWLFFMAAYMTGVGVTSALASSYVWVMVVGIAAGIMAGLLASRFQRQITAWLWNLDCPDPHCLRCRMVALDLRRVEMEILEQHRLMEQESGERTH